MKIALCQINSKVGDFSGNAEKILAAAEKAHGKGAQLAVFSEMALCGYPPLDMIERDAFVKKAAETEKALAAGLKMPALIGSIGFNNRQTGTSISNIAVLIDKDGVLFRQEKSLLPTYDVFDESRYFTPAEKISLFNFQAGGEKKRLGITICEDAWNDDEFWQKRRYTHDPVKELVDMGADILINISASPYFFGKRSLREQMYAYTAKRYEKEILFVNMVGGNDSLIFDGASIAFNGNGEKSLELKSFEEDIQIFDTEFVYNALAKSHEDYGDLLSALELGVKDYFGKCGFQKAVIGLSGGIDSALVAAIAVNALGKENVTGIAMPSMYSSQGSIDDARTLAENLGVEFHIVPIENTYNSAVGGLSEIFKETEENVAEENIQARIRGAIVMAFANKFGAMALATGNKSEMAVGYCTLYGDMNGGLAVLGDVYKTDVYGLANYINRDTEIIPNATIAKPPSAELRPGQLDSDSLPPYDTLDEILRLFIEQGKSSKEIIALGFDVKVVNDVIRRIWQNEYKRRQAAITLKVSVKAFGAGRRFPSACSFDAL